MARSSAAPVAWPTVARPTVAIGILAVGALAAVAGFMTIGANGNWDFVLPFRGAKLAGMVLVAIAAALSTVVFQAITQNRILTPAVMGFDSLYVAIQTGAVFLLGSAQVAAVDPRLRFAIEAAAMVALSLLLFRLLFSGEVRSLHLLVLAGLVFGVFFRALSGLLQRVLDPNEFTVLQGSLYASFNRIDATLLGVSALVVAAGGVVVLRHVRALDILALGRETAIGLGLDHRRLVLMLLIVVSALVAVSTALVGPTTFLGLLVASLAHEATGSDRHRHVLPAAMLIGVIALVGGQTVLERGLGYNAALGMIVELVGGLVFVLLLIRGTRR